MQHENLWAPWRMAYLRELERRTSAATAPPPTAGLPAAGAGAGAGSESSRSPAAPPPAGPPDFLAEIWRSPEQDEAHHVVHRTADGMILLNRYPYAGGHLLVALGEARPRLLDYDARQRAALWALVDRAAALVDRTLGPQGLNIGVNEGRAGGAGLPQHLHVHVIPRWSGDTNFITTVAAVRVVPNSLEMMAAEYRARIGDVEMEMDPGA